MHHSEVVHDAVLPLTWIPTKGNNIPPHAVPTDGGPDGLFYIARGLLGGEMQIGTTSYSSTEGARLQGRYGRSHTAFEYEVLTCASSLRFQLEPPQSHTPTAEIPRPTGYQNDPPPYPSPIGDWVEVPKQPLPIDLSPRGRVQFQHLARSKCFTLIDDSHSMQHSWSQTRAALTGAVDVLSSDDEWDGLDVRFLHHAEARPCVTTREEFECVFDSVTAWEGEKAMAKKVAKVFEESLPLIGEAIPPRPVILLIITDGIATDHAKLSEAILCFCQRLNEKCIPKHMFRIHILQMGDDRQAVKPLHDFRDRVTKRDRERRILNVVSFHRGRGLLNAQNIIKLLLASTHIPVDEDPDIGERLPPEVIAAQHRSLESIRAMGNR